MNDPLRLTMGSHLQDRWIRVRSSYWFVPGCMTFAAVALAMAAVALDARLGTAWIDDFPWLYANDADGSRALLSTVAGSLITVTGVIFSLTMLVVSHASAQLGPRLLTNFMRDRVTQLTLGTFVATFIYCLLVLRTIRSEDAVQAAAEPLVLVPHLAVTLAIALTLVSVLILIYFIHHVPQSINVSEVVGRIGSEVVSGIRQMFPQEIGEARPEQPAMLPEHFVRDAAVVALTEHGGYLRVLDDEQLMQVACGEDLLIEVLMPPGEFGTLGAALVRVWPPERLDGRTADRLRDQFSWGNERTPDQDALFLVDQLSQVVGKALSPGINDQFTALAAIHQFERIIVALAAGCVPDSLRYDPAGRLRVIARPVSYESFLDRIFVPLRQYSVGDALTSEHILAMIAQTAALTGTRAVLERMRHHADLLGAEARTHLPTAAQRQRVAQSHRDATRALDDALLRAAGLISVAPRAAR